MVINLAPSTHWTSRYKNHYLSLECICKVGGAAEFFEYKIFTFLPVVDISKVDLNVVELISREGCNLDLLSHVTRIHINANMQGQQYKDITKYQISG